jgi:tetratricopeptide (TPR) repeat protein
MKRWLKVTGAFGLVLACAVEARAQMGAARGQVVDENGAPVAGATVEFVFVGDVERRFQTRTDAKGFYIQVVNTGTYRVIASKDGYQGSYLDQRVRTGDPTDLPTLKIASREAVARKAMAPILEQFEKAAALSKAGKLDEAAAVYREVDAKHPDIPELHFNLGTVYMRQEKWPEAEAEYQKAIKLNPENLQAQVRLADVHKKMGRTDEAVAAMENLAAKNLDDPKLYYDLGVFYMNERRYQEAFAALDEVRKRDPDNVDVLYLLGTVSLNLGQVERAVGFLQSYLDKAPADGPYRTNASGLVSKLQPAKPPSQ